MDSTGGHDTPRGTATDPSEDSIGGEILDGTAQPAFGAATGHADLLSLPLKDSPANAPTTPAPGFRSPTLPQAPAPRLPSKDLPTATPATSHTPTSRGTGPDVSEFDPFATAQTPSTPAETHSPAGPSTPRRTQATAFGLQPREAHVPASSNHAAPDRVSSPRPGSQRVRSGDNGEPAFNFPGFLKDLRTKSAEPIARYLKSFLSNFAKKPFTVNEQIKLIHDFLAFISEKMVQHEPWKGQTTAEFDNAMEAMEKLVMNRLYNYTFTPQLVPSQPITTDDLERDAVFAQRVRLFSWIRERHLDVPEGEATQGFLGFAEQELLKINHYKAPRDKMICILNCCKVIFGLLRHTQGAEATSADAFVPILIFVVLRANPENTLSNVEYINRFRSPSKLQGEAGYYLSSLTGAIAFIETMDASSLSDITQEEFEKNVERAIQDLPPSPSVRTRRPPLPTEMSPFAATAEGEEPARPLALNSSAALDNTRRFFQRTGNQVSEAVSRPLSAIGKILDGMQQQTDGSEDGSGDELEHKWRAGGARGDEAEMRQSLQDQNFASASVPRRPRRTPQTPDSPSRRFAGLEIADEESEPPSGANTPSRSVPLPDYGEELQSTLDQSQEFYSQTRQANVQTLHQMFPALDEDVVEAVLESCGDDLGVAIDRLLEM